MITFPTDAIPPRDHVATFAGAASQALGMLFEAEPVLSLEEDWTRIQPFEEEVCVVVGFSGDLQGQIMVGLPVAAALEMTSKLMMMPVEVFDEMAHSAIAEVGNIVAGACATEMAANGVIVNISVPTVITGDRVKVAMPNLRVYHTGMKLPFGDLSFNVGLKAG